MVEVVKELQVTEATWYHWLNQYGSEKNAEASKHTKELEKENARLNRLLAEKELAIGILHEVTKGKFRAPNPGDVPYAWRWRNLGHPNASHARSGSTSRTFTPHFVD